MRQNAFKNGPKPLYLALLGPEFRAIPSNSEQFRAMPPTAANAAGNTNLHKTGTNCHICSSNTQNCHFAPVERFTGQFCLHTQVCDNEPFQHG